jgi:predicted GNAT family N-acyltransferase
MIQIKEIAAKETYQVRLEVLRKNIPLPYEFQGDFDENTFHLGAFKDTKLIAVSTFMKSKNELFKGEQYQLRGMATLSEFQGYGVGKQLMETAFQLLKEKNIDILWCNARVAALNFYRKVGMETIGKPFDVKFIGDHYVMYKNLN